MTLQTPNPGEWWSHGGGLPAHLLREASTPGIAGWWVARCGWSLAPAVRIDADDRSKQTAAIQEPSTEPGEYDLCTACVRLEAADMAAKLAFRASMAPRAAHDAPAAGRGQESGLPLEPIDAEPVVTQPMPNKPFLAPGAENKWPWRLWYHKPTGGGFTLRAFKWEGPGEVGWQTPAGFALVKVGRYVVDVPGVGRMIADAPAFEATWGDAGTPSSKGRILPIESA